jgi:hypothetical protein
MNAATAVRTIQYVTLMHRVIFSCSGNRRVIRCTFNAVGQLLVIHFKRLVKLDINVYEILRYLSASRTLIIGN